MVEFGGLFLVFRIKHSQTYFSILWEIECIAGLRTIHDGILHCLMCTSGMLPLPSPVS